MTRNTERADEVLFTIIVLVVTATFYFLAYAFGVSAFGWIMTMAALGGTALTIAGIRLILIHRFAEREMQKMEKEKEKTNDTKRDNEIDDDETMWEILTIIIIFGITAGFYFFAYLLFSGGQAAFGWAMMMTALGGTVCTIFSMRQILIRRFAERKMREMKQEKEENR